MMKLKAGKKIRLGIFVSLGTLLFIIGIYFVGKKQNLFDSTFGLKTVFKDVSGLQAGNNIRFNGINIGVIENITIVNDSSVRVDMQILENSHKFIKEDSRALIGSEGIMGNKILIITPGSSLKVVKNNSYIPSQPPINMDAILSNLKVTVDNSASITNDLSTIMDFISTGKGTIGKLLMDSAFAEDVDKTIGNIKQGAGGFKDNMDAAKSNILLRGFFRKKEKKAEEQQKEKQEKAEQEKGEPKKEKDK